MKLNFLFLTCFLLLMMSCSENGRHRNTADIAIQQNLDSANFYYKEAYTKFKNGEDKQKIKEEFGPRIGLFKMKVQRSLDSLYQEFANHKIDSVEYKRIINAIQTDSVRQSSQQLKDVQIEIPLH